MSYYAARLQIFGPHALGYLSKNGCGYDYPFTPPQVGEPESWQYSNVELLKPLGAAILARLPQPTDMRLGDWRTVDGLWREVTPPGWPTVQFLKMYDAAADRHGELVSGASLGANPQLDWRWIRSTPPKSQSEPPLLSLTLNCQGPVQYRLTLPAYDAGARYPYLEKSLDGGTSWVTVAEHQAGGAAVAQNQPASGWLRLNCFPPYLLIELSEGESWVYREEGLAISAGPCAVYGQGGAFAFNLSEMGFATGGTAVQPSYHRYPEWCVAADQTGYLADEPAGTGVTVSQESDPSDASASRLAVSLTGPGSATPILYLVQEYSDAELGEPESGALYDSEDPSWAGACGQLSYEIKESFRDSSATLRLRGVNGLLNLVGNEIVQLDVGRDDSDAEPTLITQLVGVLKKPTNAYRNNAAELSLAVGDLGERLVRKRCYAMPSFGGWTLQEAATYLCRRWGIGADWLLFEPAAATLLLPWLAGGQALKFKSDTSGIRALDEVCEAVGFCWGIAQGGAESGKLFFRLKEGQSYSGTPDFYISDASGLETSEDLSVENDLSEFANVILVTGSERGGGASEAIYRDEGSISDPSAANYVGDELWETLACPESQRPAQLAAIRARQLGHFRQGFSWQPELAPEIFPGMFGQVDVGAPAVPAGTILRVRSKHGSYEADTLEGKSSLTGDIV